MQKLSLYFLLAAALAVAGFALMAPNADAMDFDGRCFCGMFSTGDFIGVSDNDCPWARMHAFQLADACGVDGHCDFDVLFDQGGCIPDGPTVFKYKITVRSRCNICF